MSKPINGKSWPTKARARQVAAREAERRALARAVRVERTIQHLARRLDRELQRTHDRLQALALALGSHARAIEAERDVDRSLADTARAS